MNAWDYAELLHPRNQPRPPRRWWQRRRNVAVLIAAVLIVLTSGLAVAQAGCVAILPAPMVTFCPNTPAVASDMNANFAQMVNWLQGKVGNVGSNDVTVQRVLPKYTAFSNAITGDGTAAIANDNGTFGALVIAGNTSASAVRKVTLLDNVTVGGDLTAHGLSTTISVSGAVVGGMFWNCNSSSSIQRACDQWGAGSCVGGCNVGSCSKGTLTKVSNGWCYNTTDGAQGYCWATLCIMP